MNTLLEDKKCRLCGYADAGNKNIFYSKDRDLVKKIAAVYSIWICSNDPLPKCICHKCNAKVISTYKSVCRAKKLQTQWLENVERYDPNNNYVQVLSFIKQNNLPIRNFIEANFGEKIHKDSIENVLISALSSVQDSTNRNGVEKITINLKDTTNVTTLTDNRDLCDFENASFSSIEEDEEDNMALAQMVANKKPKLSIKCKYCEQEFESLEKLAEHQVIHLRINIPKLFESKCLDKNLRRGRLISVQTRQSIRCLNCYLVFDDNKSILEHWSKSECDFYCQICGEEFSQSPKLLREHISERHGISYRSLKMQRDLTFLNTVDTKDMLSKQRHKINEKQLIDTTEPKILLTKIDLNQSTNMEVSSSTTVPASSAERSIKCRICNRDFRNFNACNSHMRKHKADNVYNVTVDLSNLSSCEANIKTEALNEQMSPKLFKAEALNEQMSPKFFKAEALNEQMSPKLLSNTFQESFNFNPNNLTSTTTSTTTEKTAAPSVMDSDLKVEIKSELKTEPLLPNHNNNNNDSCSTFTSNNCINTIKNPQTTLLTTSSPAPETKPPATTTTTAPRGIRMKFVAPRSALNGMQHAIKVKSLDELKAIQNTTSTTPPPITYQHPTVIVHTNNPQTNVLYKPYEAAFGQNSAI